ncbi:YbaB/EbfC family DNA-binding protein [Nonomuraea sp. NPDC050786]|uniref:YbaB/EbfC family DNA-binding protein n=1 Tax=Nonomuraea sp. NPDC050786 TaxID=3154840 RepID=UPI003407D869
MTDFGDLGGIDMDRLLHSVDQQIARAEELEKAMAKLVGRAEDEDHLVLVEYAQEGLRTLEIRPKGMRLSAAELSEKIKAAVQDAVADLHRLSGELMAEMFGAASPMRMIEDSTAMLKQVKRAEASYDRAFEDVMGEMDRIRRDLDL